MLFKPFEFNTKSVIALLVGSAVIVTGTFVFSFAVGYHLDNLISFLAGR